MKNSELLKKAIAKGFKIGHVDIETSPQLSYHYGSHNLNIGHGQTIVPTMITSVGLLIEPTNTCLVYGWDRPKNLKDIYRDVEKDKKMLSKVVPILNNCDLLIGQNSEAFDIKVVQWRLCTLDLPKIANLLSIDTLRNSRNVFRPDSHKLDYKSKVYGFGGKIKQDMEDCIAVAEGSSPNQEQRRLNYNKKDVLDTRKMFWKEVDYYKLPKNLVNMLKLFVASDNPTFCIRCAARKEARFDVRKAKTKSGYNLTCNRCDRMWSVESK